MPNLNFLRKFVSEIAGIPAVLLRPHSIILASCKPGFRPGLQPAFRQVRAGLRRAFDQLSTFLSKTWLRTAAGSLVRARDRQMECREKNPFEASSQLAFDMLSTYLRPGLQLARIMECGLQCSIRPLAHGLATIHDEREQQPTAKFCQPTSRHGRSIAICASHDSE